MTASTKATLVAVLLMTMLGAVIARDIRKCSNLMKILHRACMCVHVREIYIYMYVIHSRDRFRYSWRDIFATVTANVESRNLNLHDGKLPEARSRGTLNLSVSPDLIQFITHHRCLDRTFYANLPFLRFVISRR